MAITPDPIILDPWQEVVAIHFPDQAPGALTYITCHTRIVEPGVPLPGSALFNPGTWSGVGLEPVSGFNYHAAYYTQFPLEYQDHNGIRDMPYPTLKWLIDGLRDQYNEPIFGADQTLFAPTGIVEPAPVVQTGAQIVAGNPYIQAAAVSSGGYSPGWRALSGSMISIDGEATGYQAGQCVIEFYGTPPAGTADQFNEVYPAPVVDKLFSAPAVPLTSVLFGELNVTPTVFEYDGNTFVPIGFQLQYPSFNGLIGKSKHFYLSAICRKQ